MDSMVLTDVMRSMLADFDRKNRAQFGKLEQRYDIFLLDIFVYANLHARTRHKEDVARLTKEHKEEITRLTEKHKEEIQIIRRTLCNSEYQPQQPPQQQQPPMILPPPATAPPPVFLVFLVCANIII